MRALPVIAACSLLAACATAGGVSTSHADLERAEIAAELAYQAAVPALSPSQQMIAWNDLQRVRQAYASGQDITALVTILQSDVAKKAK